MGLTSYAVTVAALLATVVIHSASKLADAPLNVALNLSDDMTSIKADVTNIGAEVSGCTAYMVPSD